MLNPSMLPYLPEVGRDRGAKEMYMWKVEVMFSPAPKEEMAYFLAKPFKIKKFAQSVSTYFYTYSRTYSTSCIDCIRIRRWASSLAHVHPGQPPAVYPLRQ
jgi:hypothetical protein